jgi:hypothetical protein
MKEVASMTAVKIDVGKVDATGIGVSCCRGSRAAGAISLGLMGASGTSKGVESC